MSIGGVSSSMSAAVAGVQRNTARMDGASQELAAGALDPALALEVTSARIGFAAGVKAIKNEVENTRRLIDILA